MPYFSVLPTWQYNYVKVEKILSFSFLLLPGNTEPLTGGKKKKKKKGVEFHKQSVNLPGLPGSAVPVTSLRFY